jgi:uncharacterized protein (DUF1778 family)
MKLGRPKLRQGEKKAQIAGVRLRPDEREMVEKAASLQKKTLSEWMRSTLLSTAERQISS